MNIRYIMIMTFNSLLKFQQQPNLMKRNNCSRSFCTFIKIKSVHTARGLRKICSIHMHAHIGNLVEVREIDFVLTFDEHRKHQVPKWNYSWRITRKKNSLKIPSFLRIFVFLNISSPYKYSRQKQLPPCVRIRSFLIS